MQVYIPDVDYYRVHINSANTTRTNIPISVVCLQAYSIGY